MLTSLIAAGLDLNALEGVTTPTITDRTPGGIISIFVGQYLFPIAGFLTLGIAIYGGFEYMLSYGDPKKVASGQQRITYGIIGFVVIFASWWLVRIAGGVLDIQAIQDIFGEI